VAALAALPLLQTGDASSATDGLQHSGSRVLVAYFSRTGNTRVVAGLIQRAMQADIFEISTATPYPENYLQTVEQARQERDDHFEPAMESVLPGLSGYDVVLLGFPIWGETTPPVIRSFLSAHDLTAKTLVPFITHGGYGLGDSYSILASHAPKARLMEGFAMQADRERTTMEQVERWLSETRIQG
jgi:flavodoxin